MPIRLHTLAFVLLCLIWGSTWLAIRVLVREVPPFKGAAIRFVIAAAILFLWGALRKSGWPKGERQWNAIVVLSFTMMALPYGLLFWAEQNLSSSMAAVLFSALPLTVSLFTPLMMHRKVPRAAVYAMVIAFGGVLLLLFTTLWTSRPALWGGVAVLGSMVCSAWSTVYAKTRLRDVDPVIATALQLLFGAVGLFWAAWALESHRSTTWSNQAIVALLFLATFGSAMAFAIYYWLLKHMQPYEISSLNLVVPVVAVLEGKLLLLASVPLTMFAAMLIVRTSVRMVLRSEAETQEDNTHHGDTETQSSIGATKLNRRLPKLP